MEKFATTRDGVRICWEGFGDPSAPPLLLIAGHSAQAVWWRVELIELLTARGFHVIRYDNRDVGRSQRFPEGGYTVGDMADDAAGLLEALSIPRAHVVGQSMGGMIAQELVLRHPGTVSSLTLMFTIGRVPDGLGGDAALPPAAVVSSRDEMVEQFLISERRCSSWDYPQDVAWVRELGGLYHDRGYDAAGVDRQMDAVLRQRDRLPLLAGVKAPTAILTGSTDKLIDPQSSGDLARAVPGASLRVFEGMGHELPVPLWGEIVDIVVENATSAVTAG